MSKLFKIIIPIISAFLMFQINFAVAGNFIEELSKDPPSSDALTNVNSGISGLFGQIYPILTSVTVVIALIMILCVAILYLTASPAKKAQIKSKLVYITIGIILVIVAPVAIKLLGSFIESIELY